MKREFNPDRDFIIGTRNKACSRKVVGLRFDTEIGDGKRRLNRILLMDGKITIIGIVYFEDRPVERNSFRYELAGHNETVDAFFLTEEIELLTKQLNDCYDELERTPC